MLALEAAEALGGKTAARRAASAPRSAMRATATRSRTSQARLDRREARRAEGRAGLRRRPSWSTASRREGATLKQTRARRDARPARQCRPRRFLSRRRRPRDRRRPRADRQPGHARRSRSATSAKIAEPLSRQARRRHALQHAAADAGPRLADHPRAVRAPAASPRPRASIIAHGLVEATKRAFRVRDRVVTDPDADRAAADALSRQAFLDAEAPKIDRQGRARGRRPPGEGDTIWMGAADAAGLAVSFIQSLYWEFGSGCVLPRPAS